jgi:hypothetical protein
VLLDDLKRRNQVIKECVWQTTSATWRSAAFGLGIRAVRLLHLLEKWILAALVVFAKTSEAPEQEATNVEEEDAF